MLTLLALSHDLWLQMQATLPLAKDISTSNLTTSTNKLVMFLSIFALADCS